MRIIENFHDGYESYSSELQERVGSVFQFTSHIAELKTMLAAIRRESFQLKKLFLTEEEQKERRDILGNFDMKMQETVYSTLKNLDSYQQFGWKELIHGGDGGDGNVGTTQ